jgi:hypothetical protein
MDLNTKFKPAFEPIPSCQDTLHAQRFVLLADMFLAKEKRGNILGCK